MMFIIINFTYPLGEIFEALGLTSGGGGAFRPLLSTGDTGLGIYGSCKGGGL